MVHFINARHLWHFWIIAKLNYTKFTIDLMENAYYSPTCSYISYTYRFSVSIFILTTCDILKSNDILGLLSIFIGISKSKWYGPMLIKYILIFNVERTIPPESSSMMRNFLRSSYSVQMYWKFYSISHYRYWTLLPSPSYFHLRLFPAAEFHRYRRLETWLLSFSMW